VACLRLSESQDNPRALDRELFLRTITFVLLSLPPPSFSYPVSGRFLPPLLASDLSSRYFRHLALVLVSLTSRPAFALFRLMPRLGLLFFVHLFPDETTIFGLSFPPSFDSLSKTRPNVSAISQPHLTPPCFVLFWLGFLNPCSFLFSLDQTLLTILPWSPSLCAPFWSLCRPSFSSPLWLVYLFPVALLILPRSRLIVLVR